MIKCLICNQKLLEAFLHTNDRYFICRNCFESEYRAYPSSNCYRRVSYLTTSISPTDIKSHKKLKKFIQIVNPDQKPFNLRDICNQYKQFIEKKESIELSTNISIESHQQQINREYGIYEKYNWIKDTVYQNYDYFKGNNTYISATIKPIKNNLSIQANKLGKQLNSFKVQIVSLKKQMPELKQVNLVKLFKTTNLGKYF